MSRPIDARFVRTFPAVRGYVIALAVCQFLSGLLIVAQAGVLASAIVTVFVDHEYSGALLSRLVALGLIGIGRAAVNALLEFVSVRASVRIRAQVRRRTLEAVVRLGPVWAQNQASGRLANVTGPGLDGLDGYITRALPALVGASIIPAVVLVRISVADWQSGLLLLLMLPLVPIFMALVGVTTKRRVQRQYLLLSRLAGQFLDLLRGMTTLRIYGQAERQERTLQEATERYRRETMAALRITFLSALVLDLVAALSVAVVAVDVGLRLDSRGIGFGTALVVLLLAPELFAPLRAMGAQYHANEEGTTASTAALDIVAEAPTRAPGSSSDSVTATGALILDGVSVRYRERDAAALDDIRFTVAAGEFVVLEGQSGAGKSTVLATLLGFLSPTAGAVIVGLGAELQNLDEVDGDQWRRNVAWLPQRPVPSQATVAAEVLLGDPEADAAAVQSACSQCHAPTPETLLGEDGRWVSAGQRRRIALARALLRARAAHRGGGVPLVLLDEPSEDLDDETEQVVAAVLSSMRGWATIVVATHSRVLMALAQRRITLADGHIIANRRQVPTDIASPSRIDPAAVPAPVQASPALAARALGLRDLAREQGLRRKLTMAAVLAAGAGLTGLALTATSTWLISRAAQHPNVQALSIAVVGVRTFAIARALLRYAERLNSHDAALRLLTGLRVKVFAALRPLGSAALGGYARGDLLRRFVGDVDGIQDGLVRTFIPVSGAVVTGVAAAILATFIAPIAGLVLATMLLLAGIVPVIFARGAGSEANHADVIGRRDACASATIEALPELIAYGAAEVAIKEVGRLDTAIERHTARTSITSGLGTFAATVAMAIALPAVVLAGADAVRSGRASVVDLAVLAVCVLVGFEAVTPLPAAFTAWRRCRAGLARVATVLAAAPALAEPTDAVPLPLGALGITASGLAVAPAPAAPIVLEDLDLHLMPGMRIAITGASGAGKSTLLAAALRQLPIRAGRLYVTGDAVGQRPNPDVDISAMASDDLPPGVAGSLQGDHVFDATLRDNLRVVRPDANDDDLDEVARRAGLSDFIASLPRGWSTATGPDGAALSGGQRQRLLLARALLANPRILILDEPTAHLDLATERAILADLLDTTTAHTVLISTHRHLAAGQLDAVIEISAGRASTVSTATLSGSWVPPIQGPSALLTCPLPADA